jgi:hypothetical protein
VGSQGAEVPDAQPSIAEEVERYLLTGESDPLYSAWSGSFLERANRGHDDLRGALVRTVSQLTKGLAHAPLPETDTVALTRAKVEPRVRGLFPRAEQDDGKRRSGRKSGAVGSCWNSGRWAALPLAIAAKSKNVMELAHLRFGRVLE